MTVASYVLLAVTILLSSFISGVFGMAGGMILLGVLLNYFDVASAMILFSIIQFCANGWRAYRWRHYVRWPIVYKYVVGAVIAFAAMYAVRFVPNKMMVYLSLGLMPFAIEALPRDWRPNIEWRGVPFVTGVLTTIIQVLAGVGGLFLDLLSKEHARPQDHQRHQGDGAVAQPYRAHRLFRRGVGHGERAEMGAGASHRAGRRRNLAGAVGHRAHDRPRISAMDAAHHLRRQRGLFGSRRGVVVARLNRHFPSP
jgi:hypothetical protein